MEENKTTETAVEQPQFKTVKKVRIKDFDMENVEIVPYNEDIIGDNDEVTYENYINLHGQVYPDILDSMKDGTHKMDEAESYIADYVKDKFKDKNRNVAAVSSNTVFALLVNYYMSPVVEEQIKIEPKPTYIPSAYTPLTPEQIEANRKKREQEEAERKEKARLEALRKKQRRENEIRRAIKAEQDRKEYINRLKELLPLEFKDENLTFTVIQSPADMVIEGSEMQHCVGGYYDKVDSLIMSCRDEHYKRVETIEVSLKDYKVLQSRGKCNIHTKWHDRILKAMDDNMGEIRRLDKIRRKRLRRKVREAV